jgi:surfeit locus 1 family protein
MYRFLLSPKWILGHVLVLTVLLVFPNLGLWQLRRLAEVREHNALIEARVDGDPQPLERVLAGGDPIYRRVTAAGTYRRDEEVLVTGRAHQDRPGHGVITPLDLGGGRAILVDRGWVPYELSTPPVAGARPPDGTVRVEGILVPGQRAPQRGTERVERLTAVDLDRLAAQITGDLAPVYLVLSDQQPATAGELPVPPVLPEPTEGDHFSYAVQWFLFTTIVGIGYPVLIWRTARDRSRSPARTGELVDA